MQFKSPDCAIKVTANIDLRLFGSRCLDTGHVADFPELAGLILEALKSTGDFYTFSMRVYPGRHLGVTVSGFPDDIPEESLERTGRLLARVVDQFNWHHPHDDDDRRFQLCQVSFVTRSQSHRVRNPGQVTVLSLHHCRAAALGEQEQDL